MDTKIKILILSLFLAIGSYAQTPNINFAVKFNITNTTGGDPYTITGNVNDDLSRFTRANISIGDSIYVIDGSDLYVLAVTGITFGSGITVILNADDPNNAGVSIPTGQAYIGKPTTNYKFPFYVSGLRDDLRSMIMNRQTQLIDQAIFQAKEITNFIGIAGVSPGVSASGRTGELWKNTVGELWRSDGTNWILNGVSSQPLNQIFVGTGTGSTSSPNFVTDGTKVILGANFARSLSKMEILSNDASNSTLKLLTSIGSIKPTLSFSFDNGTNTKDYAQVGMIPQNGGVGVEEGDFFISTRKAGTLSPKMVLLADGKLAIGGNFTPQSQVSIRDNNFISGQVNSTVTIEAPLFGGAVNDAMGFGIHIFGSAPNNDFMRLVARVNPGIYTGDIDVYDINSPAGTKTQLRVFGTGKISFPRLPVRTSETNIAYINTADTSLRWGPFSLSAIPQAGATLNQVLAWNGSAWSPATLGNTLYTGNGTIGSARVATITDSLSFSGVDVGGGKALVNIEATAGSNEPDFLRFRNGSSFLNMSQSDIEFIINSNRPINITSTNDITAVADNNMYLLADSISITAPTKPSIAYLAGFNAAGTFMRKMVGTTVGQVLKWNGSSWAAGTDGGVSFADNGLSSNEETIIKLGSRWITGSWGPFSNDRKVNVNGRKLWFGNTTDSLMLIIDGATGFIGGGIATPIAPLQIAKNGAVSQSVMLLSGTTYSGGTSTTTKPTFLVEPSGTTSNNWSTSGTEFGINSAGSFVGNFIDLQIAGTRKFKVDATGSMTALGDAVIFGGLDAAGSYARIRGLRTNDTYNITGTGTVTASSTISDNIYDQGQTTLTLQLPASPINDQICTIMFFDALSTFTLNGNGNNIYPSSGPLAPPTSTVLGTTLTYKFISGIGWFRL